MLAFGKTVAMLHDLNGGGGTFFVELSITVPEAPTFRAFMSMPCGRGSTSVKRTGSTCKQKHRPSPLKQSQSSKRGLRKRQLLELFRLALEEATTCPIPTTALFADETDHHTLLYNTYLTRSDIIAWKNRNHVDSTSCRLCWLHHRLLLPHHGHRLGPLLPL